MEYVLKGWPLQKEQVDIFTREYWNFREEMDVQQGRTEDFMIERA